MADDSAPAQTNEHVADFFTRPILNSPYEYPARHWELDETGQPTHKIAEARRPPRFITPIPKPRKRKTADKQKDLILDEGKGLSTEQQQYATIPIVEQLRNRVDAWRGLKNPDQWQVTPETRRLLEHWRHHPFSNLRPFFCQIEAVETVIWLTEVAPNRLAHSQLDLARGSSWPEVIQLVWSIEGALEKSDEGVERQATAAPQPPPEDVLWPSVLYARPADSGLQ